MGQKIHPVGFRIGVIRGWDSHWYFDKKGYATAVAQDQTIRRIIKHRVGTANVSRIEIERAAARIKVNIFTPRPGAVIGRGGKGIDELTNGLNYLVRTVDATAQVQVNVTEVRQPELDAQLVAENIAQQLEKRISHRRAMRQSITRAVRMNGRGIKITVGGRLNGSEIARTETDKNGKVPLHTLRADIDYGTATAFTLYGTIGVKVWIYKGEVLPEKQRIAMAEPIRETRRPRKPREGEEVGAAPAAEAPVVTAEVTN
ncbi:MAG: 30S ribosomal protein S3 [Armatimonadetes bacterium]|nr:30S ribosomal protein S3 [Armatimonadota bacterium]